ncbi:MAG: alpha-glucosidase [Acidobacteriota bacterium]|nr:alpha-glucosidase [Acidobacteriota bacterium]
MGEHWWQRAVVYQIYPKSFQDSTGNGMGDIPGITSRLPYLATLGIDVIWLSPVYESPMDDNGYDISDYRAIWPGFGTMADFDEMLARAHDLGIRIVMDLVVNHSSDEHEWFKQARSSRENPYRDFYHWRDPVDGHEPSNMGGVFGGSIWEWDEGTQQYYLHCFSRKQPDLNWENPRVRDEVFDMMDWWLAKGVDGFRMDVIGMIAKDTTFPSGEPGPTGYAPLHALIQDERVHPWLREMRRRVLSKYDTMTVGEVGGATVETAKRYANLDGSELSMVFQFEHVGLTGSPERGKWTTDKPRLVDLKRVFDRWERGLEGVAWNSLYWDNHDQPRAVSRWANDSDEWRETSAKMLATCLHLMKGTPYVYQGEELGMTNFPFARMDQINDLEAHDAYRMLTQDCGCSHDEAMAAMREICRDNARTPMQWDDGDQAGFTTGAPWLEVNPNHVTINAKAQVGDPSSVFSHYRGLIALRKESDLVVHGTFRLLEPESEELFVYERVLSDERMLVVCSFCDHELPYRVPAGYAGAEPVRAACNYTDVADGIVRPYEAFALLARPT